jgi:cytochrome c oxidase subunit IV
VVLLLWFGLTMSALSWSRLSLAFQDVCPSFVTLLFVVKMPARTWSRLFAGFSRCLSCLGHVAAMEEFTLQKSCENTRLVE